MDLTFLQAYYIPVIVGICLCVGYVLKKSGASIVIWTHLS